MSRRTERNVRRQPLKPWARALLALGVGAPLGVTAVVLAVPAGAVAGFSTAATLNVRSAPSTAASILERIPAGTAIDIACQTTGTNIRGSGVWDKLSDYGAGYVSDFYVNGTPYAVYDASIPRCNEVPPPLPPPAHSSARTMGAVATGDYFPWGWCTWGAQSYAHTVTGYYPEVWGDAYQWSAEAESKGWTVVPWNEPQARSIVVWQPGVQGASSIGHVFFVEHKTAYEIHLVEMNGWSGYGGGFGHYD